MSENENVFPPEFPNRKRGRKRAPRIRIMLPVLPLLIFAAVLFLPFWVWFFWRIEPGADQIAILIRKTGHDLPSGQILALEEGQKGIQLEVLPEGRYFRNPYTWGKRIAKIIDIPAGRLGVLTRLYGEDLPPGHIIAAEGTKGILRDILRPGKHRINPYAYHLQEFDAITIRPGHVGVITSLIGADVLDGEVVDDQRNTFLVGKDLKGVRADVLDPGSHYLNPYIYNIVEVNLQSQRFEMSGEDAINFLTMDGFTVTVEGTLEYAIMRNQAALLTHRVGDMEDILKKVILPRARGFSRIEGSKNPAISYIVGETRQEFQNNLDNHLREKCRTWGVDIKSVLIRNITPPDDIASIIRDREVAVQDAKKFEQQIVQAKSKAELTRQEMLAVQNKEKVEAETAQLRAVILAKQKMSVALTAANRELEVAKLENEAAEFQAQAILLEAEAERDVIKLDNEAQAGVMRDQADAFGSGMNLARYQFYQALGPRIETLLSTDAPDGLGALFQPLLPAKEEPSAAQPARPAAPRRPAPPGPAADEAKEVAP